MELIAGLKNNVAQNGEVVWIGLRPERRAPMTEVDQAEAVEGKGLTGDHFSGFTTGKRGVTFFQYEHLSAISAYLGRIIGPEQLRRNVVVKGINLVLLKDAQFTVGNVKVEGTGICAPCSRMEEQLGFGGFNALRGHGGITARITSTGTIRVGDAVVLYL